MLKSLKLLLPALIPSWRFFDSIAPSPRIEFVLLETPQSTPNNWQEFRPRPAHMPFTTMLKRIIWNPQWNESLFLVSCAERLLDTPTHHSEQEIIDRITNQLQQNTTTPYLQFRLICIHRQGTELQQHITFISSIHPCDKEAIS